MTALRAHDSIMSEYSPNITTIDGQGTTDALKALPVNLVGT